ncbi:hypothetical protein PLICRDRAFT_419173 [Plicaturopsis crispa FD-325 SS-3]|nr:hypothetical protein PLICRDRAFT_419173 [Plicaturopsis crispa FD-325 SS-3]
MCPFAALVILILSSCVVVRQLHRLFDSGEWLLLPSEEVIRTYDQNGRMPVGPDFPHVPNGTFEYTLMAKETMSRRAIHREPQDATTSDQGVTHRYPYRRLGLLKSHIHPCFVIWNAGLKLQLALPDFHDAIERLYVCDEGPRVNAYELTFIVLELYKKWSLQHVAPHSCQSHSRMGAISISSSQVTKHRRAAPPPRFPDNGPDGSNEARLTSRTLRAHRESYKDQQVPWTTTVWHWIWACDHAINALEVDLLPNTNDEDEDIPDNYEFYLADDDAPDALQYDDSRERLRMSFHL